MSTSKPIRVWVVWQRRGTRWVLFALERTRRAARLTGISCLGKSGHRITSGTVEPPGEGNP